MIKIIMGNNQKEFPAEMEAMFRQRKRLFHDRMKWDVEITDGLEVDSYDSANPVYLISMDEQTGEVRGTLRLLPTTGPNMLRDIFVDAFEGDVLIESSSVWECTRFCVDPDADNLPLAKNGLSHVTCELLQGICEVGLLTGISQIVGVFDQRMIRIYKRGAWSPDIIGSSAHLSMRDRIHVGLWDISPEVLATMRAASGLPETVFESTDTAIQSLALAA